MKYPNPSTRQEWQRTFSSWAAEIARDIRTKMRCLVCRKQHFCVDNPSMQIQVMFQQFIIAPFFLVNKQIILSSCPFIRQMTALKSVSSASNTLWQKYQGSVLIAAFATETTSLVLSQWRIQVLNLKQDFRVIFTTVTQMGLTTGKVSQRLGMWITRTFDQRKDT